MFTYLKIHIGEQVKKTIKLTVVAALALGATSAFATNGATMIGYGAKSMGMGGTGIGISHGAESSLTNPALITSVNDFEVSFGGTLFMPDIETSMDLTGTRTSDTSDSNIFMIPTVSLASKINDNFYAGIGMWGTGGLGVDYRNNTSGNFMNMVTALQLMQFGVPLTYTANNFSIGITPILQYGSLDINYDQDGNKSNGVTGSGVKSDLEFGYNIGAAYETNGITIGAVYKSEIEMKYDGVMSTAINPMSAGTYTNNTLSSPAEYGVGVSYTNSGHSIAVDYKNIAWSDAEGFKDFQWEDQDVISIGYEYSTDGWAARCGYQYAESAVQNQTYSGVNSSGLTAPIVNTFNLLAFPGTAETHITLGGTYNFNDKLSLDLAYVMAPKTEKTYTGMGIGTITTEHSEKSLSFQINYAL
jgi:long-chain fatty acid transport protein